MGMQKILFRIFDFKGRVTPEEFRKYYMGSFISILIILVAAQLFFDNRNTLVLANGLLFILLSLFFISISAVIVRRNRDLGHKAEKIFTIFIPIVNISYYRDLLQKPGVLEE